MLEILSAVSYYCAGSCEQDSQCFPNECIFGSGKPRRVWILGGRVYEPGEGNGEVSLRATWERGGRILSQQGGFQVSRKGFERGAKGNQQGEKEARGMCHVYYEYDSFVYIIECL